MKMGQTEVEFGIIFSSVRSRVNNVGNPFYVYTFVCDLRAKS